MANSGWRGFGGRSRGPFMGGSEPLQAIGRDDQTTPSGTPDSGGRGETKCDRNVGPSGKSDEYRDVNEGSSRDAGTKPNPSRTRPAANSAEIEAVRQVAEIDPVQALRAARTEFLKAMQTLDDVIEKYSAK